MYLNSRVRTEKIAVILGLPKDSNDAVGIRCNLESIREKETLLQLFDTNEEKDCSQDLSLRILDALKGNSLTYSAAVSCNTEHLELVHMLKVCESATPRVRNSQGPPLPGIAIPRGRNSQGSPL